MPDTAQALRESEARYRLLVEHAPDAIVILDMSVGRFVDCNTAATVLFGTDRDTLLSHGPASLSPPTQPDGRPSDQAAEDYIRRCLAGEFPAFEWTHRTVGGRDVACEVRLVRLPDQARPLLRGSITDISWRKGLEREQERLTARLRAADKLESLGLLAGGVAHDFNNLLAVILGYADLSLAADCLDEPTRDSLGRLRAATIQARQLTDQLLVFTGRAPTHREAVELGALVAEELSILEVAVGRKARLSLELTAEGLPVVGDPVQLQQVVLNLVGNAGDAVSDPRGRIHLATGRVDVELDTLDAFQVRADRLATGTYAMLEVSDGGSGMPPEVCDRIFDPFFTTKDEGHGLGLAAVAGIVRTHGGALRVSSRVGVGTTFTLLLPLAAAAPASSSEASLPAADWRGAGRALVADDDESVREVNQALLEALGFEVLAVSSGDEALSTVQAAPGAFRLAVLDVTMAGMDGVETRGALQALAPELRVLLVSGFAREEAVQMLRDEGGAPFLQKPFGLAELRQALHGLFEA